MQMFGEHLPVSGLTGTTLYFLQCRKAIKSLSQIALVYGELSERFKEPVLKTGDSERNLGFESLTLRKKEDTGKGVLFFNLSSIDILI